MFSGTAAAIRLAPATTTGHPASGQVRDIFIPTNVNSEGYYGSAHRLAPLPLHAEELHWDETLAIYG
jgi:hypothetical protein